LQVTETVKTRKKDEPKGASTESVGRGVSKVIVLMVKKKTKAENPKRGPWV